MFSEKDLEQINKKGLTIADVESQIERFKTGFPSLDIVKAATKKNGIKVLSDKKLCQMVDYYDSKSKKLSKLKFVPASGAASRMFKGLFEILDSYKNTQDDYLKLMANREFGSMYYFCKNLSSFGFYQDLKQVIQGNGSSIEEMSKKKDMKALLSSLLTEQGLNYANLPKGLLKFHKAECGSKTPVEEHLIEGALYAQSKNKVEIHFTVSQDHMDLFKEHIDTVKKIYEDKYKVKYNVGYSIQQSNTDTIAVDLSNEPFRNNEDLMVFRPGGHGALMQNLNKIDADLIFIKNIDNVIQERLKSDTILYKKALAGVLLELRNESYDWVKKLNKKRNIKYIEGAFVFLKKKLNVILPDEFENYDPNKKVDVLLSKLNRPLRVCGMVRNEGEPGGGPFWVKDNDGVVSLQIVESSQIDGEKKELMKKSTHFNPVDIVCSIKDCKGNKYDLNKYIDYETGFISEKSLLGKELKALELPGLWNGAMANWNSVFVEVPISTFSPVKTVMDLLKEEHLYEKDLLLSEENEYCMVD